MLVEIRPRSGQSESSGVTVADIDSRPITTRSAVSGGVSGGLTGVVLSLLVTGLTFLFVTKPDAEQRRDLELSRYRAEILQRALQLETPQERQASLNLLLDVGVLTLNENSQLREQLRTGKPPLPRWPVQASSRTSSNSRADADSSR